VVGVYYDNFKIIHAPNGYITLTTQVFVYTLYREWTYTHYTKEHYNPSI